MTDRVLLCAKQNNFDDCVALACERGIGIEVQTFAYPDALDGNWQTLLQRYRVMLKSVPGDLAMHGPFMDMASGSPDSLIDQVVRRRVAQALDIAEELGVRTIVFHANFIATIRNPEYRTEWTQRQIAFWAPLAKRAWEAGMVIALENMWEFDPDIIGDVLSHLELPGLRACLDVGHMHLFSDVDLDSWLSRLDSYIVHVHLNNNGGIVDEHHGLDDGVIDYPTVLSRLRYIMHRPTFSLEMDNVEDMARSLALLDLPR